jgi:hypothetical protein
MRESLYSLVGSVGSTRLDGLPDVWGIILRWYWVVSMMTVARPLSVGKMVILGIFRRSVMAWASSGVMLEGEVFGWVRMWANVVQRSAAAAVSVPMAMVAHSVAVMKSMVGGVAGCGAEGKTFGEDVNLGLG